MLEGVIRTEGDAGCFGSVAWVRSRDVGFTVWCGEVCVDHKHSVFVSDSVAAFDIYAGFVGDGHAWQEWCGSPLHAELVEVDAFMYRHELPYAVACAVEVVDAVFPHGFSGESVELGAACPFGEDGRA